MSMIEQVGRVIRIALHGFDCQKLQCIEASQLGAKAAIEEIRQYLITRQPNTVTDIFHMLEGLKE
jgi:hypothetical protein